MSGWFHRWQGWTAVLVGWLVLATGWGVRGADDGVARFLDRYTISWLGRDHGLLGGGATCMVQTHDGFLWFGTYDGLARFDGLGFTVFSPRNTPEMPSGGIANAHVDREGRLWASTYKGLVSLKDGSWRRHGPEDGWTSDFVRTFAEGPNGTLYVTGFDGKIFRRRGGPFEQMPVVPDESEGGLGFCDGAGRYWVAKEAFVGFWDGSAWCEVPVSWGPLKTAEMLGAGKARDGRLWLVREGQLLKVDVRGVGRRIRLDREVATFWSLYEDAEGGVWITTRENGLYHVDVPPETSSPVPPVARTSKIQRMGEQNLVSVTFVGHDEEGNLWLGATTEGLARWRRKAVEMLDEADGLTHDNLRAVAAEPGGPVWVASYSGGLFRSADPANGRPVFKRVPTQPLADVESVFVDSWARVWVTGLGWDAPVYRMGRDGLQVVYQEKSRPIARGMMLETSDGRLWVGGPTRLLSHVSGSWEQHDIEGVRAMAEEQGTGVVWVATLEGLFRSQSGAFVEVRDASGGALRSVTSLAEARGLGWWVALDERGLALLCKDGSVVSLGPSVGTIMAGISIIHDDGLGGLWLAGDKGFVRVLVSDLQDVVAGRAVRVKARLFDVNAGLAWNAHVLNAMQARVAQTADGRLWFPTSKGVAVLDPRAIGVNPRPPRMLPGTLGYVDASGQMRDQPWTNGGTARIPPGARALRVGFAALQIRRTVSG